MNRIEAIVEKITQALDRVAGLCLATLVLLIVTNILLRAILNHPVIGTIDLAGILSALSIGLAVAYCAFRGAHIAVEFLVDKLPPRFQGLIDCLTNLASLVLWAAAAWFLWDYARSMAEAGLVTSTIQVPLAPVLYIISLSFVALALVILVGLVDSIRKAVQ